MKKLIRAIYLLHVLHISLLNLVIYIIEVFDNMWYKFALHMWQHIVTNVVFIALWQTEVLTNVRNMHQMT